MPVFEVNVSTHRFTDGVTLGFEAVEIIPPISRSLAELACRKVTEYCENLDREDSAHEAVRTTKITPYGFCDEGATVSTLLQFNLSPTYAGGDESFDYQKVKLANVVEKVISPSGAAIL